jgi:Zn-finger nucleic acid-binding protein
MTVAAGSLGCPRCGAPASPDATACPYCKTALALAACPSCFAKLFKGYRHCWSCGAAAGREEAGTLAGRSCPQCHKDLQGVQVGVVTLGECSGCGGLWADARSFERICREREQQSVVLGRATLVGDGPDGAASASETARYRACPECRQLMNRMNFARCSGVIVDICKPHGVWFDHDELRRVVEFIRQGGMDRARQIEKDDLKAERERLRAQQMARGPRYDTSSPERTLDFDVTDLLWEASDLLSWFDTD